ncbi:MAG TPA: hypothetical protein VHZ56_13335 [Devosia sp.]|jgi:hypothetical protein|nr:hypothetical protein [Devosia sp.]
MQHQTVPPQPAPRPVAIEIDGEPLGVVIPAAEGYRFLAVRFSAFPLDGRTFETVEAAREALGEAVHTDLGP